MQPLAEILRPRSLADFVGQSHVTGEQGIIPKLLAAHGKGAFFPSLIFWGPPGCGKTTLARIIGHELHRPVYEFSAVNASVKDIEKTLRDSRLAQGGQLSLDELDEGQKPAHGTPVIFVDEIHRFSKSQQDALLPHVEKGDMILLGATTENPSFAVIGPLLSRCRVVSLHRLEESELGAILARAEERLGRRLEPDARRFLLAASGGDARVALNVLQIASTIEEGQAVSQAALETALQKRQLTFDKSGEEFYNTISAFHKSVRGSDPDGALYWLARMLEAGQDPLYVARRLIRIASEDVGLLAPNGLLLANAAYDACARIGMPECTLALAQATVYLAEAPKSPALYDAYKEAAADVHDLGNLPVPLHIRNGVTKLMRDEGYGSGYRYEHSLKGKRNDEVEYLPDQLVGRNYYSKRKPRKEADE